MIRVKQAESKDLDDLVPLFMGYLHFYRRQDAQEMEAYNFLQERIEAEESKIFIAYMNQKALAFTQLYPVFSSVQMKRMWLLNDLFVHPDARKKGLAQALIAQAKAQCDEDHAGILLETEKSNTRANPLYLKEGFELVENNFYFWKRGT